MLSTLTESRRVSMLTPPALPADMVLDTDTYNEVDDQFALTMALLHPGVRLRAVYAAPFHNELSTGPADGMEKSYEEILRLFDRVTASYPDTVIPPAFRGATGYMTKGQPADSPAARDLAARAMGYTPEKPLVVAAVGCPVNVASALLLAPEIADRIVIVWLGGQPHDWATAREFNLQQDHASSALLFDSGAPLVQIPCQQVTDHLLVTLPELEYYLADSTPIGAYLLGMVKDWAAKVGLSRQPVWSKVIWDVSAVAWCALPGSIRTALVPAPRLTEELTYAGDRARHLMAEAYEVDRDRIFREIYTLLGAKELQ